MVETSDKMVKHYDLVSVSFHEAGHTVFGLLHYMKIGLVSVYNNSTSFRGEGTTNYETAFDEDVIDPILFDYWLKSELGLCYSGTCSERIHFKIASGSDKIPKFLKEGCEEDMAAASNLINKYNLADAGKKRYVYKQKMLKKTTKILQQYWEDIVVISHGLVDKKRLYHTDIKKLLCKKSKNKEFWKKQFKIIDYLSNNAGKLDIDTIKSVMSL